MQIPTSYDCREGGLPFFIYKPTDIRSDTYVLDCSELQDEYFPGERAHTIWIAATRRYLCNTVDDFIAILPTFQCTAKDVPMAADAHTIAKKKLENFFIKLKSLEDRNTGALPIRDIDLMLEDLQKEVYFKTSGEFIRDINLIGKGIIQTFFIGPTNSNLTGTPFRFYCDDEYRERDKAHFFPTIKPEIKRKASPEIPEDCALIARAVNHFNKIEHWYEGLFSEKDDGGLFEYIYRPSDISPNTLVLHQKDPQPEESDGKCIERLYLCNTADDLIALFSQFCHWPYDEQLLDDEDYIKNGVRQFFNDIKSLESENGGVIPVEKASEILTRHEKEYFMGTTSNLGRQVRLTMFGTMSTFLDEEWNQEQLRELLWLYCKDKDLQEEYGLSIVPVHAKIKEKSTISIPGDEGLIAIAVNLFNIEGGHIAFYL